MLGQEFIARNRLAAGLGVDGVQIETMSAGNQAIDHVQVAAQFAGVAGFAGIVARGGDAAAQLALGVVKATHVIPLPAVQGDGDLREGV